MELTAGKRQIFLHPTTVPWKISFQSAPSSHSSVKSSILWSEEAMCSISTTILKRLAESNLKVISADSVLSLVLQYVFSSELSTFDGENSLPMESEVAADAFSARHPQTCCGVKHLFHGAFLHPLHESIRAYPGEDSEGMSHCRQQRNNKCSKVLPAALHSCPLPDGKTTPDGWTYLLRQGTKSVYLPALWHPCCQDLRPNWKYALQTAHRQPFGIFPIFSTSSSV